MADQLLRLGAIELHMEAVLLGSVRLFDALGARLDLERIPVEIG